MSRLEILTRGNCAPMGELAPGVELRVLASGTLGTKGLSTGLAIFRPSAELPYHTHPCSEAIVVLDGQAEFLVEGRRYRLEAYDAMHVPAGTAHAVRNLATTAAVLHSSFASDSPTRALVPRNLAIVDSESSPTQGPETLVRFQGAAPYELAPHTSFRDLFARRLGARGICGGYGIFAPGASLPCHVHGFDESITIVSGTAVCLVAGKSYEVANNDTVSIPEGRPHRFLNRSTAPMAMIWVYAGDEPDRTLVDDGFCEGTLPLSSLPGA